MNDEEFALTEHLIAKAAKDAGTGPEYLVAYAVARLYLGDVARTGWEYSGLCGVCCITCKQRALDNKYLFFFRIVDLPTRSFAFEMELYHDFIYKALTPFFHCFEGEEQYFGLSFADDDEASVFEDSLQKVLPLLATEPKRVTHKAKSKSRSSKSNISAQPQQPQSQQ